MPGYGGVEQQSMLREKFVLCSVRATQFVIRKSDQIKRIRLPLSASIRLSISFRCCQQNCVYLVSVDKILMSKLENFFIKRCRHNMTVQITFSSFFHKYTPITNIKCI